MAWRVLDTITALLVAIALGIGSWNLKETVQNSKDIATMQANRFTSADGLEVWREIAAIRESMSAHIQHPVDLPPAWFVDRVDKLEDKLETIERRLTDIEISITRPSSRRPTDEDAFVYHYDPAPPCLAASGVQWPLLRGVVAQF